MTTTSPFGRLDHIAIVVPDTENALTVWRDLVGLPFLYSEVVQEGRVRLTHLDLGTTQLQLVEPLELGHPLFAWLDEHGTSLHHMCFEVDDMDAVFTHEHELALAPTADVPHEATLGRRAVFLDSTDTSVVLELISKQ